MRTSLSEKLRAVTWVGTPAMVLLTVLLGAGKVEKVRFAGCAMVAVGCDCVCMVIVKTDEELNAMQLSIRLPTAKHEAKHAQVGLTLDPAASAGRAACMPGA